MADISDVHYLWQDGSTLPIFKTTVSGQYILEVSNLCGVDADTVVVDINGKVPSPSLGPDTSLCKGDVWILQSDVEAGTSVQWQDGSADASFSVQDSGLYWILASNHCGSASDSVIIFYMESPEPFSLGSDTVLCPGASLLLEAPATADHLQWQDGSEAYSLLADQEQSYSLLISNQCGSQSDSISISYDQNRPDLFFDSPVTWCEDEDLVLNADQSFPATYTWSTGQSSPFLHIDAPGIYIITVSTSCDVTTDSITVITSPDCDPENQFVLPNVFSPNHDGINDFFTISVNENIVILQVECQIFDRWGNQVFAADNWPIQWDGSFHGKPLNPGVYVCRVLLTYATSTSPKTTALLKDITLIR